MLLPKITVQPHQLSQLLTQLESGQLQIPRFQRDFVWPIGKTRELLDSMYKEFPIGTFFLWRAPAETPSLIRPLEKLGIPAPQPGYPVSYILDGQQRLTSLYVVINGKNYNGRDYGRICIDLKTALRYEENDEDGFDENIFSQRDPDNKRYISVHNLVGSQALSISNSLPAEWQPVFNKAHNLFQTYPFSVVSIQEQNLADAIEIFQRINQAGKRLSRYDLVCANVWSAEKNFDFRKQVKLLNEKFAQSSFGALHETIYTQTFALIIKNKCTTAAELSLKTDEILEVWDKVIKSLQLAVNFAVNNLGVKRSDFLPYRGILVVLAYYFYHSPTSSLSAQQREVLWQWFWRVTLSERYSSTSPSRMAEDAIKLRTLIDDKPVTFTYPSKATLEAVERTKMTSTSSALRNAFLCMLALKQPKNLKDNSPVNLQDEFFSNLKKVERHHIFPVSYLKDKGWSGTYVHLIPNFCFIPSDLNKEIGSKAPSTYLRKYRQENSNFAIAAGSNLLSVHGSSAIWQDNFKAFRAERAELIAQELNRLVDSSPDEFYTAPDGAAMVDLGGAVDTLEIRLRDFIDHRLTAMVGPYYWKQTMPGDVISHVKELIKKHLENHPYEGQAKFASGRCRLDFCDVSHYEKIIAKNWIQFEYIFKKKDKLQKHMEAYRELRNCIQHNRAPSEVEQKNGEAAITWLEQVLDQYDQWTQEEIDEAENDFELMSEPV